MRINNLFYSLQILLILCFISCSTTEETSITREETFLNISYGSHPDQVFDLYLPENRNNATKTLILVHGGAWVEGDKQDMNYLIPIIKQHFPNYAIANINYRLATTNNYAFPMQIDDLGTIINKLKSSNYSISDNFGFIGISAGGQLSLLYSYAYDTNHNIKMVCSIVGPTNFTDTNYTSNPFWLASFFSLTGVNYFGNESYYESLSPLHRATVTSPPTLLLYGNADPLIPITQGQDMHSKLNSLGVYNEFNLYNGGHGNWSQPDLLDANLKMINFISNHF